MPGFIDEFMKTLGPQVTKEFSKKLGIQQNLAGQIIPQVIPLILGGLRKQKDEFGGEQRVDHILNKYGSADVLNNIGGLFAAKAKEKTADPRLGGLLGESGVDATNMIADKFKIDPGIASKMIPMLAPVVLGALTQKRDTQGLGSTGIAALLDRDGDGSILDDVAGFLMQGLLGGQKGGNVLGTLLGGLFGKRQK